MSANATARRMPVHLPQPAWIALFVAASWLGEFAHKIVELPQLSIWSPGNSAPSLISLALFVWWWRSRAAPSATVTMLVWSSVQLVGGAISVLPIAGLPFQPAQTPQHYLMHVVYAGAQLPLRRRAGWPGTRSSRGGDASVDNHS
jgi:hypothetical protein